MKPEHQPDPTRLERPAPLSRRCIDDSDVKPGDVDTRVERGREPCAPVRELDV